MLTLWQCLSLVKCLDQASSQPQQFTRWWPNLNSPKRCLTSTQLVNWVPWRLTCWHFICYVTINNHILSASIFGQTTQLFNLIVYFTIRLMATCIIHFYFDLILCYISTINTIVNLWHHLSATTPSLIRNHSSKDRYSLCRNQRSEFKDLFRCQTFFISLNNLPGGVHSITLPHSPYFLTVWGKTSQVRHF